MVVVFMVWFYEPNDTHQKIPGCSGILRHLMSDSVDWTTIGVTTTTSDGWKKTTIGKNITIYSKSYTTSGTITGTGQGIVACLITPPAEFSEAEIEDIIGESVQDSSAEIYYRRLDSLQRSGGCRLYAVSISGGRTLNGKYAITLMKRA